MAQHGCWFPIIHTGFKSQLHQLQATQSVKQLEYYGISQKVGEKLDK